MRNILVVFFFCLPAYVKAVELSGFVASEVRYFTQDPLNSRQHEATLSLSTEIELFHEWDNGDQSIAIVPYLRIDQHDKQRTHFDLREFTYVKSAQQWELRLGVRKVFWGVTEFQHLVDIINQTDLVENLDQEDKLGQPMINLALIQDWGTLDLFLMPYFRERTFPGIEGRIRSTPRVKADSSKFESAAKEKHLDFALRYSHYFGDWDIGLAHFYGTSREPRLLPGIEISGEFVLRPYYDIINQTSIDVQTTKGNWLWKFEALHRSGQASTFNALAGGFEYTFVGIFDSAIDLGVLAEYHYDDRGDLAQNIFNDDIAMGARLAFNDAQSSDALIGLAWDRENNSKFFSVEASRRLGNSFVLEIQARLLVDQSADDPAFTLRKDDYIELFLSYNF